LILLAIAVMLVRGIFFLSITRRKFNPQGVLLDAQGNYTLHRSGSKCSVHLLQYLTEQMEVSFDVEESKKLRLHFTEGENAYFLDGITDIMHLSALGATEICKLFVSEV